MKDHLVISKGTELLRVPVAHLVYIEADGNYSHIITRDGRKALVSFQLGHLQDIIEEQLGEIAESIIRIGKGFIINSAFIYQIDVAKQKLVLSDCNGFYTELSPSKEVLRQLKFWLESELNSTEE